MPDLYKKNLLLCASVAALTAQFSLPMIFRRGYLAPLLRKKSFAAFPPVCNSQRAGLAL